ncbi:MAG: hypothetical protein WC707_06765 [Candidatus Babeliaceae bacterium]|jgi:hypothetical protein
MNKKIENNLQMIIEDNELTKEEKILKLLTADYGILYPDNVKYFDAKNKEIAHWIAKIDSCWTREAIKLPDAMSNVGTSTDVLVNTATNPETRREKAVEIITNMMKSIANNKDVKPFVIAAQDGVITIEECIVGESGMLELPEIKMNTPNDIKLKSRAVRRILKQITPVLQSEIGNITYVALMRKDWAKLHEITLRLKKKPKMKLENRAGCIFLIIDEFEFVI